jgi:RHS repeat-associated protein
LTSETITGDPRGASSNGALTYSIDPVGNRFSRTSTLAALGAQSFGYDANDELTTDSYDANGNTTTSGGHTYGYDFENRLVAKDSGAVTVVYDGDGNRVAKTAGGGTTKYLVDDLNPTGYLQVMDEVSGGAVQVRYTFGNMLVSQTRNPSTSPATSFYGYDAHGNIAFLTDATGTETDSYTYDAWGHLVGRTGSTFNTRLFVGEELDLDLGLINLRNRYYNEEQGRFLTVDTFDGGRSRSPLSLNRYLYASADPSNKKDPQGLLAGAEYALGLTTAQTLAVVVTLGVGASVGVPSDVAVGEKNSCEFQEVADEFAAQAREPVVSINPKCPLYQCFCHAEVYDTLDFLNKQPSATPPTRVNADDFGRSRSAAGTRCTNDLEDQIKWHPANVGEYDQRLLLGGVTIDKCPLVSP